MNETQRLETLRSLGEELRQAFADERAAITTLDQARLEELAVHKEAVATRMHEVAAEGAVRENPVVRAVFDALRLEARATAMLAAAAAASVRALLGYESTGAYDRRARRTTTGPCRTLAAL